MKKLLLALSMVGLFGLSACVVEDDCECIYGEGPACLNSIDLAEGCSNDCDWDTITDCDAYCVDVMGGVSGICELDGCSCLM